MEYVNFEVISLKQHPELDEPWVQQHIVEKPEILGLGDVIIKDKERRQPRAGRLDFLLQDAENRRYEVEIQLGATDPSHIIRTIEYWDIERKRYPQYEHAAVLVAEDITSRFLNVVSLFNGMIPLIAIRMQALKNGNQVGLVFTTVIDQLSLGPVEEDEEKQEITDRKYWESRGSAITVKMADELLALAHQYDESLKLNYTKFYIGLEKNGRPNNFIIARPKKKLIRFEPKLTRSAETEERLENAGLDVIRYDSRLGRYQIHIKPGEIEKNKEILSQVVKKSYEASSSE